jgi:hypothetical protein
VKRTRLDVATAAVALLALAGGRARAAPAERPRVVLVGAPADVAEIERHLLGLLDEAAGAEIVRATTFHPEDVFRLDGDAVAGAGRPGGWVVVAGPVASVRAAAGGRDRFVFRHLTVAVPMSELDRERIGQTLKAALATVIEGGPGALGRRDAEELAGVAPPLPAEPEPTAPPPEAALRAPAASSPPPARPWGLGVVYEVEYTRAALLHGPGLIGSYDFGIGRLRADAWLMVRYDIPDEVGDDIAAVDLHGGSARLGMGLELSPHVHVGAALGADVLKGSLAQPSFALPYEFTWRTPLVARLYARVGSFTVGRGALSAVALVEVADHAIEHSFSTAPGDLQFAVQMAGAVRVGLGLELSSR